MNFTLWPPLESIQAALQIQDDGHAGAPPEFSDTPHKRALRQGWLPVHNHENAALGDVPSHAQVEERPSWSSGHLISIKLGRTRVGVLLDRHLQDERWSGWLTASEMSWASAFDVLLEPEDEPFEAHFGLIQVWNRIELECSAALPWQIAGQVTASRLAGVRMVAQEYAAGLMLGIEPEPGFIALRVVGGVRMLLTGTPLGRVDLRRPYQQLYREFAARLMATQLTQRVAFLETETNEEDQSKASFKANLNFKVRLKPGVLMIQMQNLLRVTFSYVITGPDQDNYYAIKSNNPDVARAMFAQSKLIDSVIDAQAE